MNFEYNVGFLIIFYHEDHAVMCIPRIRSIFLKRLCVFCVEMIVNLAKTIMSVYFDSQKIVQ